MPLFNWKMLYKTKDFRYLVYGADPSNIDQLDFNGEEALEAWEELYDEYITDFALSSGKMKPILKLERRIALLVCKMLLSGNKKLATKINVYKKELANLQLKNEDQDTVDFDTHIAIIEKWLGIALNEKKTTVRRFYTYQKMYQEEYTKSVLKNG